MQKSLIILHSGLTLKMWPEKTICYSIQMNDISLYCSFRSVRFRLPLFNLILKLHPSFLSTVYNLCIFVTKNLGYELKLFKILGAQLWHVVFTYFHGSGMSLLCESAFSNFRAPVQRTHLLIGSDGWRFALPIIKGRIDFFSIFSNQVIYYFICRLLRRDVFIKCESCALFFCV